MNSKNKFLLSILFFGLSIGAFAMEDQDKNVPNTTKETSQEQHGSQKGYVDFEKFDLDNYMCFENQGYSKKNKNKNKGSHICQEQHGSQKGSVNFEKIDLDMRFGNQGCSKKNKNKNKGWY